MFFDHKTKPSTYCPQDGLVGWIRIITYSRLAKKARMTFLQAKLEKNIKPKKIPFSFQGDFFQYDLLSTRPKIKDLSSFNFPDTILSKAKSDSVGTYGIFYFDPNNFKEIDFAFSVASDISFKRKVDCNTGKKQLYFRGITYDTVAEYREFFKKGELELRSTLNADMFEYGLLKLFVGTPIENDINIIRFLKSYFYKLRPSQPEVMDFMSFLSTTINGGGDVGIDNFEMDMNINILLLNVDPKKEVIRE